MQIYIVKDPVKGREQKHDLKVVENLVKEFKNTDRKLTWMIYSVYIT